MFQALNDQCSVKFGEVVVGGLAAASGLFGTIVFTTSRRASLSTRRLSDGFIASVADSPSGSVLLSFLIYPLFANFP